MCFAPGNCSDCIALLIWAFPIPHRFFSYCSENPKVNGGFSSPEERRHDTSLFALFLNIKSHKMCSHAVGEVCLQWLMYWHRHSEPIYLSFSIISTLTGVIVFLLTSSQRDRDTETWEGGMECKKRGHIPSTVFLPFSWQFLMKRIFEPVCINW